jgi:transposase-like protein
MVNPKKDNNQKRFSESQKRRIVSEVVSGELSKEEARRRYKIRSNSAILEWMRIFAGGDRKDANFDPIEKIREMPKPDKKTQELQAKIKRLEEELELSELRSLAYKSLVEIAKEDYGLDLEKKSGVKRSGK